MNIQAIQDADVQEERRTLGGGERSTLPSPSVADRLEAYGILPPGGTCDERVLALIEQLFVTWYEMDDDASRRAAVPYLFATERDLRAVLLAVVPLYYDSLFFDERTPTRDLVEITLVAHRKWRRWLDSTRS